MDRDQLEAWLEQGLSLERIGEIVDRHPSTVSYWLKRHDLVPNGKAKHAAKGGVDRGRLESLVADGRPIRAIAEELGVSQSTVRHWIARYDLRQPLQVRRADREAAIRGGRRTLMRNCRRHGKTIFVIENSGRVRCRRCRMEAVAKWRRRVKRRLVDEAGGCCALCGYDRNQRVLQFHHVDPAEKAFGLAKGGLTRSFAELRREAAKCVLLCANCHAEVEAGAASLSK
jgi:transposase